LSESLKSLRGSAVADSSGVVIGVVQKLNDKQQLIKEYKISSADVETELSRFKQAVALASASLQEEIKQLATHKHADDLSPILQVHRMMLHDPELVDRVLELIDTEHVNADWALKKCLTRIGKTFDAIEDVYLRSRKEDIEHVGQRIFKHLMGQEDLMLTSQSIVVAVDFSPSDIVSMWRAGVSGFVSVQGGADSHTMIVARGIGLPGLAGVQALFEHVEDGDAMIIDAEQGLWILNPKASDVDYYEQFQTSLAEEGKRLQHYASQRSESGSGYLMPLMANLEFVEEVEAAHKCGVDGVGLFRTEYLFMQADELPTEEEQYQYYAQVVQGIQAKPVTFRLLDIGADKLAYVEELQSICDGDNPALGLRGIRLLLHKQSIFKAQLRAIVRVAKFAEVSILVPMVTTAAEMIEARQILALVQQELAMEKPIALGCMIEVPAAVFVATDLAKVSDFFSIGSNDLMQYGLAVDRTDEHVSYLYDVNHPAVLQMIQMIVDAAHQNNIPVALCGELAANPQWTQTFLDMKMTSLSMTSRHVLSIRKQLQALL